MLEARERNLNMRYNEVFQRISAKVMEKPYRSMASKTVAQLDSLDVLRQIDAKFENNKSIGMSIEQAQLLFKTSDWQTAQQMVRAFDCSIFYFTEASLCFVEGDYCGALAMFEKGLKKQRREYKQSYVPIIPEAALFYIIALVSDEQSNFLPVLGRIIDPKTKQYHVTDYLFTNLCRYMSSSNAETYSGRFKSFESRETEEEKLWKIVMLGCTGEYPYELEKWMKTALALVKKAFKNGYLTAAYEAAYVLKNMESEEAAEIYAQLSKKLTYAPALSKIKRVDEWEKQINAYLSLDAVKTLMKQENETGKARIAYRFFPYKNYAQPILQTRQASGTWTAGRNIALSNFYKGKCEGMSEQDKRIVSSTNLYSYYIDKKGIEKRRIHIRKRCN